MDIKDFYTSENEKPLDRLVADGGFLSIFRTIGCIGDSLSSGEFESQDADGVKGYHDMYEYSWGQYMARMCGSTVYNFSRGGMSAQAFNYTFDKECGVYSKDKRCQCYIIALGVNDLKVTGGIEPGAFEDIDLENPENNKDTFIGNYAKIIQRLKQIEPKTRFFLMTVPFNPSLPPQLNDLYDKHREILYKFKDIFDYTYVLDFRKYAPVYDDEFRKNFYLGGHLNPMGYILTAKMVTSYIDYIIRSNNADFTQIPFIGKGFYNTTAKW